VNLGYISLPESILHSTSFPVALVSCPGWAPYSEEQPPRLLLQLSPMLLNQLMTTSVLQIPKVSCLHVPITCP